MSPQLAHFDAGDNIHEKARNLVTTACRYCIRGMVKPCTNPHLPSNRCTPTCGSAAWAHFLAPTGVGEIDALQAALLDDVVAVHCNEMQRPVGRRIVQQLHRELREGLGWQRLRETGARREKLGCRQNTRLAERGVYEQQIDRKGEHSLRSQFRLAAAS